MTGSIHSVGNLLGEGKAHRAGVAANTSIVLAVMIALFWSALFLIFRKSWARMFNDDPGLSLISFRLRNVSAKFYLNGFVEVVTLVASIVPLVALFQVFDATAAVTGGVLRARGRQVR